MDKKNVCSVILVIISVLAIVSYAVSQELILPDSGQSLCYDWERILCDEWHMEGSNQVCDSLPYCPEEGEDFYGQDATYSINPPDLTDNGDGTIKDNLTGLTWEQKSNINEPLTFTYAAALNYCPDLVLGGKDDWRMPTRPEYSSILNSNFTSPALDRAFFPHYTSSGKGATNYWTASGVHDDPSKAWAIELSFGLIYARSKILLGKIRCVSGSTLPVSSFVDNEDGTVTDDTTGLMWEQKTDDGSSRDRDIVRTWNDSLQYCEDLNLGGYSDWRLPTTREQERIVDLGKSNPAVDTQFFPDTQNALYWSGTTCAGCHKHKALSTDYTDGTVYFGYKKRIQPLEEGQLEYPEHYERCVRGGQCIDLDEDTVCDNFDNCPNVVNLNQEDSDDDSEGDACDPDDSDESPAIEDGPFLVAGPWPVLPTSSDSPIVLDQNYSVLWTFSDDFAFCSGDCTHSAEYQAVGGGSWTPLAVTANAAKGTARVTLPVESLQNATTYALRYSVTDCAGQTTQSGDYYFRVATSDDPPVITGGPWLAAGSWPLLPTALSSAFVLEQNYDVLWTFSDDYAYCSGLCTHRARYRKVVDDGSWTWEWLPVTTDATGKKRARVTLPIESMEPGDYMFYFDVRDCAGQRTSAPKVYYFKVEADN